MINVFAPDRSDQPFSKAILPRRGRCSRLVPDAHGAQSACDDGAIDAIPIADEVKRSLIPRECLGKLACDPFCRRICCDVDPDEVSAIQSNDNEGIEQVEADGWGNEQVHSSDVRRVITQKGAPPMAWRSMLLDHVFGDARLCDLEPELEQFTVNTRCAPKWVLDAHLSDQRTKVSFNQRPPSPRARLPTPVAAKARTMPTHERLGPDDRENIQD